MIHITLALEVNVLCVCLFCPSALEVLGLANISAAIEAHMHI